jgi:hypothetical protein
MELREYFLHSGGWLFRWRSYLPVLLFSVVLLGLQGFHYSEDGYTLDVLWELFCLASGSAA